MRELGTCLTGLRPLSRLIKASNLVSGVHDLWIEPLRRFQLVEFFRSLDAALDEHKEKGTPTGAPVYHRIYQQLAEDVALLGVGKDHIPEVAAECGQLSTYRRLEQAMTMQNQPKESAAITLLNDQLNKLMGIRSLDLKHPDFILWRDSVANLFQRFLSPDSSHFVTFRDLRFRAPITRTRPLPYSYRGPRPSEVKSPADAAQFEKDCAIAEVCIRGAMDEIRNFGVYSDKANPPAQKSSGAVQNFFGTVNIQNQAIATDNAIQHIEQMGNTGNDLKEIAELLKQSMDLTGREQVEGLKSLESIATEVQRPEQRRNWKGILDAGEKLTNIVQKTTDVATKLAPYMPTIATFIEQAKHHL
jgi:hypothetical protein